MDMHPTHEALVEELKVVRQNGLIRMRSAVLPVLQRTAERCEGAAQERWVAAVEDLLRRGAGRLGDGPLQRAAEYTFGLVQGTRDWPASSRRKSAAEIYGVSVDRFRKHYEKLVIAQLAEAILAVAADADRRPAGGADSVADGPMETRSLRVGGRSVTVHTALVDLLDGIDVIVCPTNTYLELAEQFKFSIAAGLRSAGAIRRPTGEIIQDCVADDLNAWRDGNARPGLQVEPGTVVPIDVNPGSRLRFRRIYFAAVARPRAATNEYTVEPGTLARAVRAVFREAATDPSAVTSICFPLLGAGRAGLPARASFAEIWSEIEAAGLPWRIHFVSARRTDIDVIVSALLERGATEAAT